MSSTPVTPAENSKGKVKTWVSSQWKFRPKVGQFSVQLNILVERTGLTAPTVNAALSDLDRLGIVQEVTGRRRGRVFSYRRYLAILGEGTDPLPPAS